MSVRSPGYILRLYPRDNVCLRCQLSRGRDFRDLIGSAASLGKQGQGQGQRQRQRQRQTRLFSQTFAPRDVVVANTVASSARLKTGYFLSNRFLPPTARETGTGTGTRICRRCEEVIEVRPKPELAIAAGDVR